MSVTTLQFFQTYIADGITPTFSAPFYIYNKGDLSVYVNGVLQPYQTSYSLVGVADNYASYPAGANVVFVIPPIASRVVLLLRTTDRTQLTTFIDNGPLIAGDLNHAYDKLTLITQENSLGQFIGTLPADPPGPNNVGDWYIVAPPMPGGPWGRVCVSAGIPATWNDFGIISL